jgi:hypothetical protein
MWIQPHKRQKYWVQSACVEFRSRVVADVYIDSPIKCIAVHQLDLGLQADGVQGQVTCLNT